MAEALNNSIDVPYDDPVLDNQGFLTRSWIWFFRNLYARIYSLGVERSFVLVNNQAVAADIDGLKFDKGGITQAVVEYLVQRVTTGGSAVELIESGILIFVYKPTSDTWVKVSVKEDSPTDAGITFSITSDGQVQYTTTNATGTPLISNLFWRARTLAGKNSLYSRVGAR